MKEIVNMHNTLELIAKNSPHLSWVKENTILIVKHGSHAYGTNIATSDEDFKRHYYSNQRIFLSAH